MPCQSSRSAAFASSATIPSIQLSQMSFLSTRGLPCLLDSLILRAKDMPRVTVSFAPATLTSRLHSSPGHSMPCTLAELDRSLAWRLWEA